MPCTCSPPSFLVTEYNTMVCTTCGIESRQMLNPAQDTTYNAPRNPLHQRVYNRPDRWKTLVKKVVGLHNGPPQHDPVWELLKKHAPFSDVAELTKTLRGSRLKHKHYQSLHAFAKAFVPKLHRPYRPSQNGRTKPSQILQSHPTHVVATSPRPNPVLQLLVAPRTGATCVLPHRLSTLRKTADLPQAA